MASVGCMVAVIRQLQQGVTAETCTQSPELTALRVKYPVEAADRVGTRQDQGVSDEQGDVQVHLSTNH